MVCILQICQNLSAYYSKVEFYIAKQNDLEDNGGMWNNLSLSRIIDHFKFYDESKRDVLQYYSVFKIYFVNRMSQTKQRTDQVNAPSFCPKAENT